ncbi:MAG: methyltransferase domain-containing protein [Methylophilaceae bacterium]|nr:methyltransferase domain-containing protein [Methylophilaceae bacterium]
MAIPQLSWNLDFLKNNPVLKADSYGIPDEVKHINYPIRLVRYWFIYHFLREEIARKGALDVCEIGVDRGQMLGFMQAGGEVKSLASWDAVDCIIQRDILQRAGYQNFYEIDLESAEFKLDKQYDAMILLHVLEHLFAPEAVVKKIASQLKPGGILIGGFPSLPDNMVAAREQKIRSKAGKFGHVSVFSPERVRAMAKASGLELEFLTGAFFMRKKGFFLENYQWWFRFNLWFGSRFPSWPGETYWILRKPLK